MSVFVRLCIMMFLQFFVWGAWFVSMTGFFKAQGMSDVTGAAYTVGPLAAIIAPLFLGIIADRFFSGQKVLACLHFIGAIMLFLVPMSAASFALDPAPEGAGLFYNLVLHDLSAYTQPLILLLFVHMLCYMPTISLSTSISFEHLSDSEKQFPIVRVFGTIGWIAGNIAISLFSDKDASAGQFYLAGGAGLVLGCFSLLLPNTPPKNKGQKTSIGQILGIDSLRLMKNPNYAIMIVCSFLLCIPLAGYYAFARTYVDASGVLIRDSATFTMSLGQMSEIFFMLIMPFMFRKLGIKWMLVAGMGAWVLRYALFAMGADDNVMWMILFGIILHGICYDFFFVTGMVYVEKKAPEQIRNQAQGFLVLVTQGLGLGIGAKLFMGHYLMNSPDGVSDWGTIWQYPAIFAFAVAVIFIVLFRDDTSTDDTRDDNGISEADAPEADAVTEEEVASEPTY